MAGNAMLFCRLITLLALIGLTVSDVQQSTVSNIKVDVTTDQPSVVAKRMMTPAKHPLMTLMSPMADVFGRRFIQLLNRQRIKSKGQLTPESHLRSNYVAFQDELRELNSDHLSQLIPSLISLLNDVEMSDRCADSILLVLRSAQKGEAWTSKMFNSNGQLPAGFLSGTTSNLGDYRQCLNVKATTGGHDHEVDNFSQDESTDDLSQKGVSEGHYLPFEGQYCLMSFKPQLLPSLSSYSPSRSYADGQLAVQEVLTNLLKNTSAQGKAIDEFAANLINFYSLTAIKLGICIPSTCKAQEFTAIVSTIFKKLELPVNQVALESCSTNSSNDRPLRTSQLIALTILTVVLLVVLVGTAIDLLNIKIQRRGVQSLAHLLLISFSARRNVRRLTYVAYFPSNLVSSNNDQEDDQQDDQQTRQQKLNSIHGLRFGLMVFLVVVNTFIFGGLYKVFWTFGDQFDISKRVLTRPWFLLILNGWQLTSDGFFVISGALLTLTLLPKLEETKGKLNYLQLIAHRWVRLVPGLLVATSLYICWPLLVTGPLVASVTEKQLENCEDYFWASFTFLSNWTPAEKFCVPSSWHISAEFQLYLIGPLFVYIIHRNHRFACRLIIAVISLITLLTSSLSVAYEMRPLILFNDLLDYQSLINQIQINLLPTHQRIVAYLIGILIGYYIYKPRPLSMSTRWSVLSLLIIANLLVNVFIPFTTSLADHPLNVDNQQQLATFSLSLISRPLWAGLIGWTLVASMASGGHFMSLLSSRKLVPLSRLGYSFTLVSTLPIFVRTYSLAHVRAWNNVTFASDCLVNLITGLFLSLLVHLALEQPILGIEKGIKNRIEHNEVTKLRSLRAAQQKVTDVEC